MLDVEGIHDLESAKAASHGCVHCGGEGFATTWHCDYDGRPYIAELDRDGRPRRQITETVAYCTCAAGRWIMFEHQTKSKSIFARITDLHVITKGDSLWLDHDPTLPKFNPATPVNWKAERARFAAMPTGVKRVSGIDQEQRQMDRQRWLIQLLVHVLRDGPTPFEQIYEMASQTGRGDMKAITQAAEILGVRIGRQNGKEVWSMPKEASDGNDARDAATARD